MGDGDTWTVTTDGSIHVTVFGAISNEVDDFTLYNYGSLTAINTGPLVAFPFATGGIEILGDRNRIFNHGIIHSSDFDAISIEGDNTVVENFGNIIGGDDGIDLNSHDTEIANHGTITADRDGIEINGDNTTIVNSGTIVAGSDAFDLNGDNATISLILGSNIQGDFSYDGANGTLNIGKGMNVDYRTDGGNPDTITAARDVVLQDGNQIFSLNLDQNFAAISGIINQTQSAGASALRANRTGQRDVATRGMGASNLGPWIEVSTDYSQALSTSNSAGYRTRGAQITAGFDLSDTLGLMIASGSGEAYRTGSFSTTHSSLMGGLYGELPLDGGDLSWGVVAGKLDNTAERFVQNNTISGGFETATGIYSQSFIAPSLTYATRLQPGAMLDVELSHAQIQTDAYVETGATNNASFAARTTNVSSLTSTLSWTTLDSPIPFDMSAGLSLRHYGGDQVGITIGAASGSFSDADSRYEGKAFVRARMEHQLGNAWTLTSHADAGYSSLTHLSLGADLMLSKEF